MMARRTLTATAALLALPWAEPGHAQAGRSAVLGLVVTRGSRVPIEGARITLRRSVPGDSALRDSARIAESDRLGRFRFDRLDEGRYWIAATHAADSLHPTPLDLGRAERVEVELAVGPADPTILPELSVEAAAPVPRHRSRDEFLERRASGMGQYITREQILARNPPSFVDVFRMATGLEVRCRGSQCLPRAVRAPPGCYPVVVLDGVTTDIRVLNATGFNDVYGVEIYLGLSEVPMELLKDATLARCGVIVVWTRSGLDEREPPRRRPPDPPRS